MKVHDEIESMIDVYLAGGLSPEERIMVETHARECEACTASLEDAAEFHNWMKGKAYEGAPASGLEDRIIANLRASAPPRRWLKIRGAKALAGIAALFVFIVIGGLVSQSDQLAEVQNKLVARSGVEDVQERGPAFTRHTHDLDGYAGDTTTEGTVNLFKSEMERGWASSQSVGSAVGGGAGGFRGRAEFKNVPADKAPAPATEEPRMDADESDRDAMAPARKSLDAEGGEKELLDQGGMRPEADPGQPPPVVDDRKIIRNADLHLEVDKYDDAYLKIGEITRAKKGFIAGVSTTKLANGKIRATVTLRIPPDKFEETLAELGKLGIERHRNISTADVTKQYTDLQSRLKSKETLVERLKKVLLEGKGTVKELMEVEVQMGATIEQIEQIKGELKYYDNLVGMSTITMQVFEKDMGLPFEYVQTLQSVITVRAIDADAAYAKAHQAILDAGGQVVESRMTRSNEQSASGFVRGKVDAEKFPAVRETLKALGQYVDTDTVNQQQTGRGGKGDSKPGAPVRKEQAVIDFTVNTPPIVVTRQAAISIEASPAESAYQTARQEVKNAGGEIIAGSLMDKTNGASAFVKAQIDEDKFAALVEKLKSLGKVKNATVKQDEPGSEGGRAPLLRKKGEIVIEISTPPPLIPEESGLGRVLRDTFSRSIAGLLWSVEKLFVGIALAGPWILLAILVILIWRRARRTAAKTS
jgi:hypothetical protein